MGQRRSSLEKDFEKRNPSCKESDPKMLHKKKSTASPSVDIRSFAGPRTHDASLPPCTRNNKARISSCSLPPSTHSSQTCDLRRSHQNNLSDDVEVIPKDQELPNAPKETSSLENGQQTTSNNVRELFKSTRRNLMPEWPDEVEFDENEDVVTIDADGNYDLVSHLIHPNDVQHANGVKYFVTFNEFYQPLKKGGHILVKFIGDVAKQEQFCPIRETNWRHVKEHFKVEIVKLIRSRFVIPNGDCYDQGILKRTGKSLRLYRHSLKKKLFKPTTLTKEQIYQLAPSGHPHDSWIDLVDYWYGKGQRYSDCGKEARALQNHVHTSGAKSYANIRASFEERNNREPSVSEMFRSTHQKKDGMFVKDSN
ncbi:uncharacterized protein LOC141623880 [Silene latifolia]|uniref:uncharacterized protein LOC141623880 n=1 Tax=Silene latifolia TaxID=37657 RepID=UPI003D77FE1D